MMKRIRAWFDRPPRMTSIKWLGGRGARQETIADLLRREPKVLDENFINALSQARANYEGLLSKVLFFQITLTAAIGLSLLSVDVSFSLFGLSSNAVGKLREFLLFAHGVTITYGLIVQQHVQKIEDVLVGYLKHVSKDDDELKVVYGLRYLGPLETLGATLLPYRRHLNYGENSRRIIKIQFVLLLLAMFGFVAFTMGVPILAALRVAMEPNYGALSYLVAAFWSVVALWAVLNLAINVVGLPLTDYSYVMKLTELMQRDPDAHRRVMREMVLTKKLPPLPDME